LGTIRTKPKPEIFDTKPVEEYYDQPADYDMDNGNSQTFGPEFNIMTSAVNVK
jgi:hypothetical protein